MDRKIIKILLVVIVFIGVASVVVAIVGYLTPDTITKIPGLPREEGLRLIGTDESSPGYQTVENKFDGYKITVPSNWIVPDVATWSGGMKIYYEKGVVEVPLEIDSGLLLTIFTMESAKDAEQYFPASTRFDEMEIGGEAVYVARFKAVEEGGFNEDFDIIEIPIEESQITSYIFRGGGKTYLVNCRAIGDDFIELVTACEAQVQTFVIAN